MRRCQDLENARAFAIDASSLLTSGRGCARLFVDEPDDFHEEPEVLKREALRIDGFSLEDIWVRS